MLGARYRCAEYSFVLADVLRASGLQARAARWESNEGAHVTTEVWWPEERRWVLLDGQFGAWVTRAGAPLSALELLRALREGATAQLEVHSVMDSAPEDFRAGYLGFVGQYAQTLMVSADLSLGHQFHRFAVVTEYAPMPEGRPAYLENAQYAPAHCLEIVWGAPESLEDGLPSHSAVSPATKRSSFSRMVSLAVRNRASISSRDNAGSLLAGSAIGQ
jgi:hypothetical protein